MVSLNSDHLPDYAPYQEKILRSYNQSLQQGYGAEPLEIAEAIFEAATDDSNLLRYPCPKGGQVDVMLKMRHEMPVESFQDTIKAMFGG